MSIFKQEGEQKMFKIAHLERFVKDNPGLFPGERAEKVLDHAHSFGSDPLSSGKAVEILGQDSETFLDLIGADREYIKISFEN